MRARRGILALPPVLALVFPAHAYAQGTSAAAQAVPPWLWGIAGVVGMTVAVLLLIDAIKLRKVAEGSIVAENIAYMMNSVACFAAAVLAGWVGGAMDDDLISAQAAFAQHLLLIVGMALLAVYFMRVRFALTRFLQVLYSGAGYPGAGGAEEEPDA